uniref:Gustatory receptor n=1 Tax=Anopheles atroparvus TaxID=41427 RepID=A0A182J662_ANOAO
MSANPSQPEKLHRDAPKPIPTGESSRKSFLRCLRPLHYLSCVFGLWPFLSLQRCSEATVHPSAWCPVYSLLLMVTYSAFHLYINYTDAYGAAMGSAEGNFVSMVIDIYNRYSGLVLFWLLHIGALVTGRTLTHTFSGLMLVDEQIAQRLSVTPDHPRWCRFICLHMALIFLAIGFSEWYNCIMYMSDFIPASEYCIFQCYITMLTSSTVEIQYMALVEVIKSRLRLINELLAQLNDYDADQERTHYEQFQVGARPSLVHPGERWPYVKAPHSGPSANFLLDEISATYAARRSAVVRPSATICTPLPSLAPVPATSRGDQQRWQKIKRLQHKIITVNQAPPPGPAPVDGGRTQFPLLVASLLNSQSGACEHIRLKIINDIKNLYTHLHLLSLNINKAYGAQLIFILMTLFVTLTTLLYYCTMKLFRMLWLGQRPSHGDLITTFWEVLSTLSWAFISTFRILRICSVCNAAKTEVRMLSLQLQQQRIEFTAGGLLTIDHGLMFNIVGSLATYLLILIQFDIAQNGAKWKAEPSPPAAEERP